MEYEIEGTLKLPRLIFDEEKLTVIEKGKERVYWYKSIEQIQIVYKQWFSDFGAIEMRYQGKMITIMYNKLYTKKVEKALKMVKQPLQPSSTSISMPSDPVAYLQKCKEMLELGLITEDDYNQKKQEVLSFKK